MVERAKCLESYMNKIFSVLYCLKKKKQLISCGVLYTYLKEVRGELNNIIKREVMWLKPLQEAGFYMLRQKKKILLVPLALILVER